MIGQTRQDLTVTILHRDVSWTKAAVNVVMRGLSRPCKAYIPPEFPNYVVLYGHCDAKNFPPDVSHQIVKNLDTAHGLPFRIPAYWEET